MFPYDHATSERPPVKIDATPIERKGRILVVDDNPSACKVISHILNNVADSVEIALDGHTACRQALAASAKGFPFDLILMDIQMPVMDGYAATIHLRNCGYFGFITALTADLDDAARDKCRAARFDDVASKPISFDALCDLATRNLKIAKTRSGTSKRLSPAKCLISSTSAAPLLSSARDTMLAEPGLATLSIETSDPDRMVDLLQG
jgi:CheY-like chemotaxis protein